MAKKKKPRKIVEYELPSDLIRDNPDKIILGCDPGSRNFGIALVGVKRGKPKIYANAVMSRPLNSLLNFNEQRETYKAEIKEWLGAGDVNAIVAERFQTRGNGGPLIELVSFMLGILDRYDLPMKMIVASQWKNEFKRRFDEDLKDLYDEVLVQPHQLDAALIGIYGLEQGLQTKFDYDYEQIFKQVEKTSLIGLRKVRTK